MDTSNVRIILRNSNHQTVQVPDITEAVLHPDGHADIVQLREEFDAVPKVCNNKADRKKLYDFYNRLGREAQAFVAERQRIAPRLYDIARSIENACNTPYHEIEHWRALIRQRFNEFDERVAAEIEARRKKTETKRQKIEEKINFIEDKEERQQKKEEIERLRQTEKELVRDRKELHMYHRKYWVVASFDNIQEVARTHPEFLDGNPIKVEAWLRNEVKEGRAIHEGTLPGITLEEVTSTVYRNNS